MTDNLPALRDLALPFDPRDIEWRAAQVGKKQNGEPWIKVLAYVTNRAIMQRLDDVVGPANWKNEYRYENGGKAVLCGLSILVRSADIVDWVTKWDGAEETDIEAVKGGLSGSMKRAAVQWGIGRYLYDLEEGWGVISEAGQHYVAANAQKGTPAFKWSPPKLPNWALPKGDGARTETPSSNAPSSGQSGTPSRSGQPSPSRRRADEKKTANLTQKNINDLIRKSGGDEQLCVIAASAALGKSLPSAKAEDWPAMTAADHASIVEYIEARMAETRNPHPVAIQVADKSEELEKLLADTSKDAKLRIRILAAYEKQRDAETLTLDSLNDWIKELS